MLILLFVLPVVLLSPIPDEKPLIYFDKGQVGVNFGGFYANAGLGGFLTGNPADGGLHAEAGTPFGQNAVAGFRGGFNDYSRASGFGNPTDDFWTNVGYWVRNMALGLPPSQPFQPTSINNLFSTNNFEEKLRPITPITYLDQGTKAARVGGSVNANGIAIGETYATSA